MSIFLSVEDRCASLWRALTSPQLVKAATVIESHPSAAARQACSRSIERSPLTLLEEAQFRAGLAIRAVAPRTRLAGLPDADLAAVEAALRIGGSQFPSLLAPEALLRELASAAIDAVMRFVGLQRPLWEVVSAYQWIAQDYHPGDGAFLEACRRLMPAMRGDYLALLADGRLAILGEAAGQGAVRLSVPESRLGLLIESEAFGPSDLECVIVSGGAVTWRPAAQALAPA